MNFTRRCAFVLILCICSICKTQGYDFNACPSGVQDLLNVTYGSLVVECGTLYDLELVISPPRIAFSYAVEDYFYEILMLDPDAPLSTNPTCRSWLHMLLSDVKGSDLKKGISASGDEGFNVVTAFMSPGPPKGDSYHRYILAAFGHAEPLNIQKKITQRCGFDIDLFTETYNLQPIPDANNMFKTHHEVIVKKTTW